MAAPRNAVSEVRKVAVADLKPHPENWRTHPSEQRSTLSTMMQRVGFASVLYAYEDEEWGLTILDGHLRTEELPDDFEVDVAVMDFDRAQAREFLASVDPMAMLAVPDIVRVEALFKDLLPADEVFAQLLATIPGVTLPTDAPPQGNTDPDDVPEPPKEPVTKLGDLWLLGDHRLLCGDSTDAATVSLLMDGEKAALIHADPPYGMGKENEGVQNDNLYREKLDTFQMAWWKAVRPNVEDNGSAYIWGNAADLWRLWYSGGLADSERLTLRNEAVWDKGHGEGMESDKHRMFPTASERCLFFMLGEQGFNNNADNYWDGWEPIRAYLDGEREKMGWDYATVKTIAGHSPTSGMHWFDRSQWSFMTADVYNALHKAANGKAFKRDHDELKRDHDELKQEFYATRAYFNNTHDNMTDVWDFDRVKGDERHGHATPKPVAMMERVMNSSLPVGGLCIEPFGGSGSTLIAAERTGRKCYTLEISQNYCDVIINRWQNYCGKDAVLSGGKKTFAEVQSKRLPETLQN